MRYHKYFPVDVVNGEGTRCSLFVSGCEHKCKGCYNKTTWSVKSGFLYTQDLEEEIINNLRDTSIPRKGLSISGGDPLHPVNIETIYHLVKRVKKECPDKDIWLWTGYELKALSYSQRKIITYIDVLIDGKFIQDRYSPDLLWRGSDNQIIHRFKLK